MGREIRKVPPNWDHPKEERSGRWHPRPMYDVHIDDALAEWLADFDRIRAGNMTTDEREFYPGGLAEWMASNGPPDPDTRRPWKDEEATWFQVWETVSEGTPVTPPFATADELVDYLAANGDFWDQKRATERRWPGEARPGPWPREAAERFVKAGWAPSLIVTGAGTPAVKIYEPRDGFPREESAA